MTWSLKHIEQLKAEGKIRDYKYSSTKNASNQLKNVVGGRIVAKHFKKSSRAKDWIASNLLYWCNEHALTLQEEYRFHPERKWRFDFCIESLKLAIEFEGGIYDRNGSHTSFKDISRDIEKYNSAASLGWKVLRFTAINYQTLVTELNRHI